MSAGLAAWLRFRVPNDVDSSPLPFSAFHDSRGQQRFEPLHADVVRRLEIAQAKDEDPDADDGDDDGFSDVIAALFGEEGEDD